MALPIAIGMLVQTLYYLVDLYFVSQLGDVALAGVGAAGNLMFLLMALTQMLSVGTISTVSHAVGADDQPRANVIFNQSLMMAGLLAVLTLAGGYLGLGEFYVEGIAANESTAAAGKTYLFWFVPAMSLHFFAAAMGGALQGTGIVKPTMVVQMISVLSNVVLTPILVAGWLTGRPMGVAGAGLSTTLSALIGVTLMTIYFVRLEHYVSFDSSKLRPRFDVLKRMLSIGAPAGGEFGLMFVFFAVIYAVISVFGSTAQAGFGIGMRVMQAVFLPALAVSFAAPAIAGQNFGAGRADRVRETFRTIMTINFVFMISLTLLCQWRPGFLVGSFTNDPAVLEVAAVFMTIISWNFVANGVIFTCSGMFQGMGNTVPGLASTATRLLTFVGPVLWLASRPGFQIEHVWYTSVTAMALQAVVSYFLLRREFARRLHFASSPDPV
jgi:putative MATE family efflux protein